MPAVEDNFEVINGHMMVKSTDPSAMSIYPLHALLTAQWPAHRLHYSHVGR
jgi:hypothetical protein